MTNAISKTTAPTNEECDELLIQGVCSIRDAILGYTRNGLVQKDISERIQFLGLKGSVATIQRHVKDLRNEGLLPAVGSSTNPKAVQKRKERAQHEATKPQNEGMSPTDDSSSPLIHPEVFNHVTDDEPSYTCSSISGGVSNVQSKMDSSSDRYNKDAVPLDTANNGAADEEYNEVLELIDRIKTISSRHYRPNQPGTWTEHQWLNLTELYFTMHSIAEGYSRDYKQERRDYADQCIKQVTTFFDTTDGSSSNRIGGNA